MFRSCGSASPGRRRAPVQRLNISHRGRVPHEDGRVLRLRVAERASCFVVRNDAPARLDLLGGVTGRDGFVHGRRQFRPFLCAQSFGDLCLQLES